MQIPRRLLIHNVTLEHYEGEDPRTHCGTYADAVQVGFVRLEPVKETALGALGEQQHDRYRMFYDFKTSSPPGLAIGQLDRVTFGGESFIVRKVQTFHTVGNAPHHAEAYLVGSE